MTLKLLLIVLLLIGIGLGLAIHVITNWNKYSKKVKGIILIFMMVMFGGGGGGLVILQQEQLPTGAGQTYYEWYPQDHTVNGQLGYYFNTTADTTSAGSFSPASQSGSQSVYGSIDVKIRHSDESEDTLGTKVALKSYAGSGALVSNTWTAPLTALEENDALKIVVFCKVGTKSWEQAAIFMSEQITEDALYATTWTVWYYLAKVYVGGITYGYFYWGDTTHGSKIENIEFGETDTTPPTCTSVYYNTSQAGEVCKFNSEWEDQSGLSKGIFSYNSGTGWANESCVFSSGKLTAVKTLPSVNSFIQYRWYANDTWNNWGAFKNGSLYIKSLKIINDKNLGFTTGSGWNGQYYNGTVAGEFIAIAYTNSSFSPNWKYEVKAFSIDTQTWTSGYIIGNLPQNDEHHNPSLCIRPDGKLVIFYGYYDDITEVVSTYSADSVSLTTLLGSWGSANVVDDTATFSYAQALYFSDKMVMFARENEGDSHHCAIMKWTWTVGSGWSSKTQLFNDYYSGVYWNINKGNSTEILVNSIRTDLTSGGHWNGTFFFFSPDKGDTWYNVTGHQHTPPLLQSETLVCETNTYTKICQPSLDEARHPVFLYVYNPTYASGGQLYPNWEAICRYSKPIGTAGGTWTVENITDLNGNPLMNMSMYADLDSFYDSYYHAVSFWGHFNCTDDYYSGQQIAKYIIMPNGTRAEMVYNFTDYQGYYMEKVGQIRDYPSWYEQFGTFAHFIIGNNIAGGTYQVIDAELNYVTRYAFKFQALETCRIAGIMPWLNITAGKDVQQKGALYDASGNLIAAQNIAVYAGSGISPQDKWTNNYISLPNYPTLTKDAWYYLAVTFNGGTTQVQLRYDTTATGGDYKYRLDVLWTNDWESSLSAYSVGYTKNYTILGISYTVHVMGAGGYETDLAVEWNELEPETIDVGHTLGEINASLNIDGIDWSFMVLYDGSNIQKGIFIYGEQYDKTVQLASMDYTLWIWCNEADVWTHTY